MAATRWSPVSAGCGFAPTNRIARLTPAPDGLRSESTISFGVRKNAWLEPWTWKRTRGSVWPRFSRNVSGRLCAGLAAAPLLGCGG